MALGNTVLGDVVDARHFVLDFPDSTFITRYTRSGADATATVGGHRVRVGPGSGTFGDLSPEDLLPGGLWSQLVQPYAGLLQPAATPGAFTVPSALLSEHARKGGTGATDWRLSVRTDASGRLSSLGFGGANWGHAFAFDLTLAYR